MFRLHTPSDAPLPKAFYKYFTGILYSGVFFLLYFLISLFLFPTELRLSCVCVVIGATRYYVQYIRGSLSWVASGIYSRFFQARVVRRMHQYGPGTSWADSRSHFLYVSGGGMNCVSSDKYMYCTTFGLFARFP